MRNTGSYSLAKLSNIVVQTFEILLYKQCLTFKQTSQNIAWQTNYFSDVFEKLQTHYMLESSKNVWRVMLLNVAKR